jgi:Flp pilus assembly protein TadD
MFEQAAALRPKAEVFVGNLADGYRWAGDTEKARATYDRAIGLALEQLKVNPRNATVKSHLALFYAKSGDASQARRQMTDARAIAIANVELMYNEALMFALLGEREKAFASLQQAFQAGYPVAAATADPDLRSLRSDPRYQQLQTKLASARPS